MGSAVIGPWLAQKDILLRLKRTKPVIFDVGAHVGSVTDIYLRMFPESTIYCFEPIPESAEGLRKKYAQDSRVRVFELALGNRRQTHSFHIGGRAGEMSSLSPRPRNGRRYYRHLLKEVIQVKVETVNEFCQEHKIPRVDLIKLDIHGGEYDALRGACDLLSAGTLALIYAEVFFVPLYEGTKIFSFIAEYLYNTFGYEFFDIYNILRTKVSRRATIADVLFVSPQVVKQVINPLPEEWLQKSHPFAIGEPS